MRKGDRHQATGDRKKCQEGIKPRDTEITEIHGVKNPCDSVLNSVLLRGRNQTFNREIMIPILFALQ